MHHCFGSFSLLESQLTRALNDGDICASVMIYNTFS
jgi:hypothetical protein